MFFLKHLWWYQYYSVSCYNEVKRQKGDTSVIDIDVARFYKMITHKMDNIPGAVLRHNGKKLWIDGYNATTGLSNSFKEGREAYIEVRGMLKGELRAKALKELLG